MREPLKLEVGKYYEDRSGEIHGPVSSLDDDTYPFVDYSTARTWTKDGVYYQCQYSDCDLIKEVPNPNQESETMSEQPAQPESAPKFKEISLTEALDVLKTGQSVFVTTEDHTRVDVNKHNDVTWILDATKFEIEVKPVVKYLVVYGDFYNYQNITTGYFESIEEFYSDYDKSQYPHAELIQFTRKEF